MHRAALQDVADRVGGIWHRQAGSPEPGTDRTIRVGVLSRLSFTTLDPVAPFPDKLRAIQQGDGRPDEISAMGRPALHVRVHADGTSRREEPHSQQLHRINLDALDPRLRHDSDPSRYGMSPDRSIRRRRYSDRAPSHLPDHTRQGRLRDHW